MHDDDRTSSIPKTQASGKKGKGNSASNATPPKVTSICIGALRVDYPGEFLAGEMPDQFLIPLDSAHRAFSGIKAVAKILYANEIERQGQGENAELLDITTTYGLFEALIFMATEGKGKAEELGEELFAQAAKGGA